jgi:hypothetical protein
MLSMPKSFMARRIASFAKDSSDVLGAVIILALHGIMGC